MFNVYHGNQEREGNCKQLLQFVVLRNEIVWNEAFWRGILKKKDIKWQGTLEICKISTTEASRYLNWLVFKFLM